MEIEEEVVQEEWDESLEPVAMSRIPEEFRGYEILEEEEEKQKLVRSLVVLFKPGSSF